MTSFILNEDKIMPTMPELHFTAHLDKFDSNLWGYHIVVPDIVAQAFLTGNQRRVVCTLNETETFQCALMPKGEGVYFININKKLRDKLKLKLGSEVQVTLREDNSDYGLPMPEELAELLKQDEEGNQLFHALTPGRQRTLLYHIGSPKSSDTRLLRAIATIEHLKANGGKVNYRVLFGPKGAG